MQYANNMTVAKGVAIHDGLKIPDEGCQVLYEGYWRRNELPSDVASDDADLPFPVVCTHVTDEHNEFVKTLELIQSTYYALDISRDGFLGYSCCRLCGKQNGSEEYELKLQNGDVLRWPSGLLHYYRDHHVAPSKEFVTILQLLSDDYKEKIDKEIADRDEFRNWYASLSAQEKQEYEEEQHRQRCKALKVTTNWNLLQISNGVAGPKFC